MNTIDKIIATAQQRAANNAFDYFGAATPQEAHTLWTQGNNHVVLVDVRTQAELDLVGRVPNALHIEWAFYPGMVINVDFADMLTNQVSKDATVIFMCRTGGRSHHAAALADSLGYTKALNMLEGFEGDANAQNQRTLINGWKYANLPWTN